MRTIAVLNWKGGSGKTTTALALAVGLAERLPEGQRVLLVDVDPQANSTLIMCEGKIPGEPTLFDVMMNDDDDVDAAEAIRSTRVGGVDILPADGRLADCTVLLANEIGRERRLRIALRSVEGCYAICIVDAPPQLSLLTLNILQAVNEIIVPIDPGLFAVAGLGRLQETVDAVRRNLEHPDLTVVNLVMARAPKGPFTDGLLRQLKEVHGDLVSKAVIPNAICVERAHASYRTVLEAFPKSDVAKAYRELVSEVLKHGRDKKVTRPARRHGPQSRAGKKRRAG
jgi:chromosome partitioning protein